MKIDDYTMLKMNKCPLRETSKDSSKKPAQFMVDSSRMVVDFDRVKEKYLETLGVEIGCANSVDALFQDDNRIYLVEFKNGEVDPDNIRKKAKDSLLILNDITNSSLSYTRQYAELILVISDDKFRGLSLNNKKAAGLARLGKIDYSIYGLDRLRGYCFNAVNLMSAGQFERRF